MLVKYVMAEQDTARTVNINTVVVKHITVVAMLLKETLDKLN